MHFIEVVSKIVKGETVVYEPIYELFIEQLESYERRGRSDLYELLKLELFGGDCPVCKKPFRAKKIIDVRLKNEGELISEFYEPSCHCYPVCPICKRSLHWEFFEGEHTCRHCGSFLCQKVYEKTEYTEGRKRAVSKNRCGGVIVFEKGGWACRKCGERYTGEQLSRMLIGNSDIDV